MSENKTEGISRRDFIKRASKEAADTGARIVPGGQIAKRFVEGGKTGEGSGIVEPSKRPWWERLVNWKQERTGGTSGE
jgi:hypothetical protein